MTEIIIKNDNSLISDIKNKNIVRTMYIRYNINSSDTNFRRSKNENHNFKC